MGFREGEGGARRGWGPGKAGAWALFGAAERPPRRGPRPGPPARRGSVLPAAEAASRSRAGWAPGPETPGRRRSRGGLGLGLLGPDPLWGSSLRGVEGDGRVLPFILHREVGAVETSCSMADWQP